MMFVYVCAMCVGGQRTTLWSTSCSKYLYSQGQCCLHIFLVSASANQSHMNTWLSEDTVFGVSI